MRGTKRQQVDALLLGFVVVAAFVALIVYVFAHYLGKNSYKNDDQMFSQAGVTVKYSEASILIKSRTYPVAAVTGIRWVSGKGQHGNISEAVITVNDMTQPTHKVSFITPAAAESFVQRLSLALQKAGGPTFTP